MDPGLHPEPVEGRAKGLAPGVTTFIQPPHELTIIDSPNKCVESKTRNPHTPAIAARLTPGVIVVSGAAAEKIAAEVSPAGATNEDYRRFEEGFVPFGSGGFLQVWSRARRDGSSPLAARAYETTR
jgi:hypothetical protein